MHKFCFSELLKKEIICISNGRKIGYATDASIGKNGQILELIVPAKSAFSIFGGKDCVKVPWCDVDRVGEDVIWICGCKENNYDKCN